MRLERMATRRCTDLNKRATRAISEAEGGNVSAIRVGRNCQPITIVSVVSEAARRL